eukprot:s69_g2.t1
MADFFVDSPAKGDTRDFAPGILGTFLYTVNPLAPFIFATGLACCSDEWEVVMGRVERAWCSCCTPSDSLPKFCARLGFGDDIETAEAKRARRSGLRRVSSWTADRSTQSSQASWAAGRNTQSSQGMVET